MKKKLTDKEEHVVLVDEDGRHRERVEDQEWKR